MSKITYHVFNDNNIWVALDGKKVGVIKKIDQSEWQYWPKCKRSLAGRLFSTLNGLKNDIESE